MRSRIAIALALALGAVACARILGFKDPAPRPFAHRAHLIRGISCIDCHSGIERAGDTGPLHLPTTADCVRCHETPHDARDCSGCHGVPFAAQAAAQAREHIKFTHESHSPRVRGNCVRCHPDVASDGTALRPPMATCFGCHAHRDQFRARDCDGCHVDLPAELTRPESHLVHDGDFLREHGVRAAAAADLCESCHKQSFCAGCHGQTTGALPERLAFDRPLQAGVHRAGFRSRHAEEARGQPGLCTTCHTERSCQGCHRGTGVSATSESPQSPHPAGWLGARGQRNDHGRAARLNPADCASCHGGAGEALCVGCHRVGGVGGNPHPPGYDSDRPRTEPPCVLCHRGGLL